jgi:peptide/nickel transport system substrate-binding protein
MNGLKPRWLPVVTLLYTVMLVVACASQWRELTTNLPSSAAPQEQRFAGALRVALTALPNSLDCPQLSDINASLVALQLYNSLLWIDDEGRLTPALAERWEISADGTAYTFYLRHGVVFHNGEPFTADAVVTSWQRGIRPEMRLRDRWAMVSAVEKVDDYTVILRSEQPNALLLRTIAGAWCMAPPHYLAEVGEAGFLKHPVGTGPFMLEEWMPDERVVLQANPTYWEAGLPKLAQLSFRPIPEAFTRAAAVRTGEIDIAGRLSVNDAALLEEVANIQVIHYPVDRVYVVAFNNLTSGVGQPTERLEVRHAMNYAVDRQGLLDTFFEGYGRPATGFVTPANLGYDITLQPYPYDPEKARQLLAEAGYPDGFSLDFACPAKVYANFDLVCQAVQGYLQAVGIQTELELVEAATFWDLASKKELPPLFGDGWTGGFGDAYPCLFGALGGFNAPFSAWSDPQIDALLAQIRTTLDEEARAALYRDLQHYMLDNPPFIYLYELETLEAVQRRVQNYRPRPSELKSFKATFVSDGE